MPHYIPVSAPVYATLAENITLKGLLERLGTKYKEEHNSIRINRMNEYKAGIEYINKKCNKNHKTAIRRTVESISKTTIGGDEYRKWRFHKQKVTRFLKVLHRELKKLDEPIELEAFFDNLYNRLNGIYYIQPKGSEIASFPYHYELEQKKCDVTQEDEKAICEIQNSFNLMDEFYNK